MKVTTAPVVSVVIPALNEEQVIRGCLEAMRHQSLPAALFEVIVVDNGSTDGTAEVALSFAEHLRISVLRKEGVRISAVRNYGAARAHGEVLAFLDADCVAPQDWLSRAIILLRDHPSAVIGAYYAIPSDSSRIAKAWYGDQQNTRRGRVAYIPGSDLILRRKVFQEVGGFDESLQTSEDCEFCQRAAAVGWDILAFPPLSVIHMGGPQSLEAFFRKQLWQGADVPKVFWRDARRSPNRKTIAFALYTLLGCLVVLFGAVRLTVSADWSYLLGGTILLLAGCGSLAVRAALIRKTWRVVPPLVPLYFLYGLARGLWFVAVRAARPPDRPPEKSVNAVLEHGR